MRNKILFIAGTFLFAFQTLAQIGMYDDYLYTFSRQLASTRAESMGYCGVANGGTVQETRLNPASLAVSENKLLTEYMASSPVFIDKRSSFAFIGFGYQINKTFSVGYNTFRSYIWRPILGYSSNGRNIQPKYIREVHHTATISAVLGHGLSAGINAGHFVNDIDSSKPAKNILLDAGLLWKKQFKTSGKYLVYHGIQLGLSAGNLTNAVSIFPIQDIKDSVAIPAVHRAGAAWKLSWLASPFFYGKAGMIPKQSRTIDLLIQTQYLHYGNAKLKTQTKSDAALKSGYGFGAELAILKVIYFRIGYRFEKRLGDDELASPTTNYSYLKGLTNGLGLSIPFHYLKRAKLPFDLAIDLCHQKPFKWLKPSFPYTYGRTTSVSIRLNWFLGNKTN